MSPLCEDSSDNEADSPSYQSGVQRGQTRKKTEEFPDVRTLNKLVQRRVYEVKLQSLSEPTPTVAKVSDSSLSEEILECEFSKKSTSQAFDY